jgi:mannosyltransferase
VAAATLTVGAIASLLSSSTFASRYASVVLPLVILIAARGVLVVPGRRAPLVVTGAAALLALGPAVGNVLSERTQARDNAEFVREEAQAGDVLAVCPDQLGPAMRRALDQKGLADLPVVAYPALDDGRRVDWRDYEERNDAVDPRTVGIDLANARSGSRIWVVWNGGYRTFEDDCEDFINGIAEVRGGFRIVEQDGGGAYFEHAALILFA